MKFLFVLVMCLWSGVAAELYPSNTVVYDGDTDVTLDCEHGELDCVLETVHWIYINESNNITIATNNQTSDEVDAHKYEIVGEYNLVIKNITMEDGGKYFCYCDVVLGDADIYYADLIVLAGDPYCSGNDTVEEHDIVEYKCEIEYSGYWPPVMEWYQDGTPVINYSITVSMINGVVQSRYIFKAAKDNSGDIYECRTYFDESDKPDNSGLNTPDYSSTYTSESLDVHYTPRNSEIYPHGKSEHASGEFLACVTDSNPLPNQYHWYKNGEVVEDGDAWVQDYLIVIPESWEETQVNLTCLVSNGVGNYSDVVTISFLVIAGTTILPATDNTAVIVLSVFLALFILLTLALLVVILLIWRGYDKLPYITNKYKATYNSYTSQHGQELSVEVVNGSDNQAYTDVLPTTKTRKEPHSHSVQSKSRPPSKGPPAIEEIDQHISKSRPTSTDTNTEDVAVYVHSDQAPQTEKEDHSQSGNMPHNNEVIDRMPPAVQKRHGNGDKSNQVAKEEHTYVDLQKEDPEYANQGTIDRYNKGKKTAAQGASKKASTYKLPNKNRNVNADILPNEEVYRKPANEEYETLTRDVNNRLSEPDDQKAGIVEEYVDIAYTNEEQNSDDDEDNTSENVYYEYN